jgi:hypothetical protein
MAVFAAKVYRVLINSSGMAVFAARNGMAFLQENSRAVSGNCGLCSKILPRIGHTTGMTVFAAKFYRVLWHRTIAIFVTKFYYRVSGNGGLLPRIGHATGMAVFVAKFYRVLINSPEMAVFAAQRMPFQLRAQSAVEFCRKDRHPIPR